MKVEISRRRFLQGSVALSIAGGTALKATNILTNDTKKIEQDSALTKSIPLEMYRTTQNV